MKETNYDEFITQEIERIKKEYNYLELDTIESLIIVKDTIYNIQSNNTKTLSELININVIKYAKQIDKLHLVVNNYINTILPTTITIENINKTFDLISKFFNNNEIEPDFELYVKLFKTNPEFYDYTTNIFKLYKVIYLSDELENRISNNILIDIINVYAGYNGIEKEEAQEENNEYYSGLDDSVAVYLKEIGTYPLLDFNQEKELANRIKQGDKEAEDILVKSNLRLVVSIAKKYTNPSSPLLDLVQDGSIGLMTAVKRYNPDLGCRFSTYATWWIKQSINRYRAQSERLIKVPVHVFEGIRTYKRIYNVLYSQYGRTPTDEEIQEKMGITTEQLQNIKRNMDSVVSYNTTIREDSDDELLEIIPNEEYNLENEYNQKDLINTINYLLENSYLTDKEKFVLKARYGFINDKTYTLEEIGQEFGVTRERIRQIQNKAQRKFKKILVRNNIRI